MNMFYVMRIIFPEGCTGPSIIIITQGIGFPSFSVVRAISRWHEQPGAQNSTFIPVLSRLQSPLALTCSYFAWKDRNTEGNH